MTEDRLRVLIDTNVFIEREKHGVIHEALQEIENNLKSNSHTIYVHPESKREVRNYENEEGRKRAESKIATYAELKFPEYPKESDTEFRNHVPKGEDFNEKVDNALLYAVYSDQVDYLITRDEEIHEKAKRLNIGDFVLNFEEGRNEFSNQEFTFRDQPSIQRTTVSELDVTDEIFDPLREEYPGFNDWFRRKQDADAYVNWKQDGSLGAVLIIKPNEAEAIGHYPQLPKQDRLKIRTLTVAPERRGYKIGERLINISIREAIHYGLNEVYLTHYKKEEDYLLKLISMFGFQEVSQKENGESVFLKRLTPGMGDDPDPFETHIRFYPSFYDGTDVNKFVVPIRPKYHGRLFPAYEKRQPKIHDFVGEFLSEENAIKKAYLCHAPIRKIEPSDLLLFYRSRDYQEITSLGVCERIEYELEDPDEIRELVGKRSVYSDSEIEHLAEKPTTVILFKWHFDLENPLHFRTLVSDKVLNAPPQSIHEIDDSNYEYIKKAGGLDERFVIN